MSTPHYDVLVIGLGVIGASISYHAAQRGLRVLAVDRAEEPRPPTASWASAGGVRRQGRDPAEAALATEAIARWPTLATELEADLHYRQGGQLLLAESEIEAHDLANFVAKQHAMGFTDICLVSRAEALELVPGLNADVLAGSYSPTDGQADATRTAQAFARAAERFGATIWTNTPVAHLVLQGERVVGVNSGRGIVYAETVVLAAGAWGAALCRGIGLELPVRTEAYQMLLSTRADTTFLRPVIGAVGRALSLKQLNDGAFLIGGGYPGTIAPDGNSCSVRLDSQEASWRTACELLPSVGRQHLERAWCGLEALCIDEIPLIGPAPEREGLFLAIGFSGHGFAIAPAIGRAVADQITGRDSSAFVGLTPARIARFEPATVAAFLAGR